MKKIVITCIFSVFALAATFALAKHNENSSGKTENAECKYGQCGYIKKNYEQCKNCVSNKYDSYCYTHS